VFDSAIPGKEETRRAVNGRFEERSLGNLEPISKFAIWCGMRDEERSLQLKVRGEERILHLRLDKMLARVRGKIQTRRETLFLDKKNRNCAE